MLQYILALILIAITARVIAAVKYVQKVTASGLKIIPRPAGLTFWFKGHLDLVLQGRPFDEIRFYFIPFIADLLRKNEMPIMFLPGPILQRRAVLFMTDPVAVRECFSSKHMTELHKGPEYNIAKELLGNGILASNEDVWHRQRKICDLGFVNSIIKSSVEKAAAVSNLAVDKFLKLRNSEGKIIITADIEVALIAADVMGQVIFGYNFNAINASKASEAPMYQALKTILRVFNRRLSKVELLPNPEFKKNLSIINNLVDDIVASEKENKSAKSGTLLSHLIDGDYKGQKLTETEIKDNIKTFMFAGQDTTSSALAWATYYLAANPDIQLKAREEVDRVLGRDRTQPVTYEKVKNELVYISYIMKEVLRIKPSAAFTKVTTKDITLPGSEGKSYFVPQGIILHFNPMFIQIDPKHWGEDSLEFKPDRWGNLETESDLSMIYFPFSQGHRSCIGASFAKAKFATVVAKLLQSFELKLTNETEKTPPRTGMDLTLFAESYTLELVERK